MTALEFMTDEGFEREFELRRRLLPYVIQYLNDDVIRTASDAIGELLTDVPYIAEDLLQPLIDCSGYWAEQMAMAALCLSPDEDDLTVEDLLEIFEMCEAEQETQPSEKTDWMEEGF